mmetsp:Transcript_9678/g.33397  ORF Transcript_9678/g.33397 Transcript_9678/m.33397 type:complete len:446 (-) Transcript_9678:5850-7187(-)
MVPPKEQADLVAVLVRVGHATLFGDRVRRGSLRVLQGNKSPEGLSHGPQRVLRPGLRQLPRGGRGRKHAQVRLEIGDAVRPPRVPVQGQSSAHPVVLPRREEAWAEAGVYRTLVGRRGGVSRNHQAASLAGGGGQDLAPDQRVLRFLCGTGSGKPRPPKVRLEPGLGRAAVQLYPQGGLCADLDAAAKAAEVEDDKGRQALGGGRGGRERAQRQRERLVGGGGWRRGRSPQAGGGVRPRVRAAGHQVRREAEEDGPHSQRVPLWQREGRQREHLRLRRPAAHGPGRRSSARGPEERDPAGVQGAVHRLPRRPGARCGELQALEPGQVGGPVLRGAQDVLVSGQDPCGVQDLPKSSRLLAKGRAGRWRPARGGAQLWHREALQAAGHVQEGRELRLGAHHPRGQEPAELQGLSGGDPGPAHEGGEVLLLQALQQEGEHVEQDEAPA